MTQSIADKEALKPCPFCGGAATLVNAQPWQSPPFYVICKNKIGDASCQCKLWPVHSAKEAVRLWNTRAADTEGLTASDDEIVGLIRAICDIASTKDLYAALVPRVLRDAGFKIIRQHGAKA